jgi:hypothetical protein
MGANAVTTVPVYVSGEVLTAADMNITNSGIPVFATTVTRDAAFGGTGEKILAEGQFAYLEDSNTTQYYDGAAWQPVVTTNITNNTAEVLTAQTTTSGTYTDLATAGPAVTVTTGTKALVLVYSRISVGSNNEAGFMSFAISGATTAAAAEEFSLLIDSPNATVPYAATAAFIVTLTAGSNVFTAKYKSSGGATSTFTNRKISVINLGS